MEPSTLLTKSKPPRYWFAITLISGMVGSLIAIGAGGSGTYNVAPFKVKLRAYPVLQGKTELAIAPGGSQVPIHAQAGTHKAPIAFRATVIGLTSPLTADDIAAMRSPRALASFYGENAKSAVRSFALKLLALAIGGGGAAGLAISLGRWRRVAGGAVAGLLTFAIIGLLTAKTYDASQFARTNFVIDKGGTQHVVPASSVIPLLSSLPN